MAPRQPPRRQGPLAAAAALLLLAAGGCAGRGSGSGSGAAAPPPSFTLAAPATVTAGQAGYQATMTPQAGATYAWTLTNGAVTFEDGGPAIRFTAGTDLARPVTLACTVTFAGASQTRTAQATVRHGPQIQAPATAVTHQGAETASAALVPGDTYTWSITGGQLLSGQGTHQISFLPAAGAAPAQRALAAPAHRQGTAAARRALDSTGAVIITLVETSPSGASGTTTLAIPQVDNTADPPANFAYTPASATATVGQALAALTDASDGGSITAFRISPALPPGLALDPETGFIAGTPTAPAPATTYTVTASNPAGSAQATLTLAVLPAPTRAPAGLSYTPALALGACNLALTPLVPTFAGGDPATAFSVAPALPAGLVLGSDGTISGIPTVIAPAASYTVTAGNNAGSTTATVSIAVAESAPAGLSYTPANVQGARNVPLTPLVPAFAGGSPATRFAIDPPLPAGLALAGDGTLNGTPTELSAPATYTITAGNGAGATTATVRIAVAESAPASFSYTPASVQGARNVAITPLVPAFAAGGGPATRFTVSPDLPPGLVLGPDGTLQGTPTGVAPLATYTITAGNAGGLRTATVAIAVAESAPTGFSYTPSTLQLTHNVAIAPLVPAFAGGGPATSFTVDPALPAGLTLGRDGAISGTPTAVIPPSAFVVTAGNDAGSSLAILILSVVETAPAGFSYTPAGVQGTAGVAITPLLPSFAGGDPATSYRVSPALPAGLVLGVDGAISGTPAGTAAPATYTVTAGNSAGSASATVTLAVAPAALAGFSYAPASVQGARNAALTPLVPAFALGGPATSFSISPALPAGLALGADGVISGIPTGLAAAATYTVTASNSAGSASATVTLAVAESAPAGFAYSPATASTQVGTALATLTASTSPTSGGPPTSYSISPDLPAGLSLGLDGSIYGTPSAALAAPAYSGTYTVIASNSAGSATATVTLTVQPAPPTAVIRPGSLALMTGRFATLTAAATGAAPFTYAWTRNASPVGGNSASLALSWVGAADAGSYRVTVTDALGRTAASAPVTVTVNPALPRFLYVGHGDGTLLMFSADGGTGRLRRNGMASLAGIPSLMATAPGGQFLFTADQAGRALYAYALDPGSGRPTAVGQPLMLPGTPQQLLAEPSGSYLYVLWTNAFGSGASSIRAYAIAADGSLTAAADLPAGIFSGVQPATLAADPQGRFLLATDSGYGVRALAIGANGALSQAGARMTGASAAPVLAVHPAGTLVYALSGESSVLKNRAYHLDAGGLTAYAGANASLSETYPPVSATLDPAGAKLYVLCRQGGSIRLDAFVISADVPTTLSQPYFYSDLQAILLDPTGRMIYELSSSADTVWEANAGGINYWNAPAVRGSATTMAMAAGASALVHGSAYGYAQSHTSTQLGTFAFDPGTGAPAPAPLASAYGAATPALTANTAGTRLYEHVNDGSSATFRTVAVGGDGGLTAVDSPDLSAAVAGNTVTGIYDVVIDPSDSYALVLVKVVNTTNASTGTRLLTYRLDAATGSLGTLLSVTNLYTASATTGFVRIDPTARFIYVVLDKMLQSFTFNWLTGALANLDSAFYISTGPGIGDPLYATAVQMHPNGQILYINLATTNATHARVLAFALSTTTGHASYFTSSVIGYRPVDLAIAPDGSQGFVSYTNASSYGVAATFAIATNGALSTAPTPAYTGTTTGGFQLLLAPSGGFLYLQDLVNFTITTLPVTGITLGSVPSAVTSTDTDGNLVIIDQPR